jgi:hypothetical protein
MVHNLLETGTPFDYGDVDFDQLINKYEQFEADLADDNDAEDDGNGGLRNSIEIPNPPIAAPISVQSPIATDKALNVGDMDVPTRDERFIDQRQEQFETYIPEFEDED